MNDPYFLIARRTDPPEPVHIEIWPLGVDPTPEQTATYVQAACAILGLPPDWDGLSLWDISISPGEPHPSLLAQATVHDSPPT